jgi:SAM-dependent methyltransferase
VSDHRSGAGQAYEIAAAGFGASADAFDRGRPEYPDAVGRWLAERLKLGPGARVADLAAGTGKLTRVLAGTGAWVTAIEPVAAMREALSRSLPGLPVVAGMAESIPFADDCLDVVAVGQAFHWFSGERAVAEIARVLHPRGALVIVFNRRDADQPIQSQLGRIMEARRGSAPRHADRSWQGALAASPLFELVGEQRVRNEQVVDADRLVDRVVSVSFIANLPSDQRAQVAAEVRGVAHSYRAPLVLRYITESLLYDRA